MIPIDAILQNLKNGVLELAGTTLKNYATQAKKDGLGLLDSMKAELGQWAVQVKNGEMSEAELKDLIKGQLTLAKMETLTQAGIAKIEIDRFKKGLVNLISETILKIV